MNTEAKQPDAIYPAMAKAVAAIAREGVSKSRQVTEGPARFRFRGIDEVMNALAPILADAKISISPRFLERSLQERPTSSGRVMFNVVVRGEFDFISLEDGSRFTVSTYGEAQDSGDKATNKAMSAAFKYAAFQALCIPTEGDGDTDPDAMTHEAPPARPASPPRQNGNGNGGSAPPTKTAGDAEYAKASSWADKFVATVRAAKTVSEIGAAQNAARDLLEKLRTGHPALFERLSKAVKSRVEEIDLDDDVPF